MDSSTCNLQDTVDSISSSSKSEKDKVEDLKRLNSRLTEFIEMTTRRDASASVSKYPHLADKGEVIYPATANEHLNGWHGGNYKNSLPGEPIKTILDF